MTPSVHTRDKRPPVGDTSYSSCNQCADLFCGGHRGCEKASIYELSCCPFLDRGCLPGKEKKSTSESGEWKVFSVIFIPAKINISPSIQVQPVSVDSFLGSPEHPVTPGTGNRVTGQLIFLFCFVLIFDWAFGR